MTTATTTLPAADRSARRGDPTGGGLTGAVASEWTKLWSVRSVWWNLLASALLMAAAAGQEAIYVVNENTNSDPADDPGVVGVGTVAISSVLLAQFTVLALAMLVITAEYATGTIRSTLQWTPSRGQLLLAKTAVVAVVTFVVGALLAALGSAVADPVLGEWGRFRAAETVGDVLAVAAYLSLISVFTLGLGTALRSAVGTLTTVFMILMVVPIALGALDIEFVNRLVDGLPGVAGHHFMSGDADPYPPAAGLALLAAWALAAMLAGYAVLRSRDA
ncbi:ABC transporter permease [Micromonospora sp. NPDC052213]|uniref:ABC transporter permease n=1 Tax=Micromonospora sp. NPDC052213 TaxID=3155812 RepID=UPI00343C06DB